MKGHFQVIVCFSVCALGRSLCIRREWGERAPDESPRSGASDTGGWRDVHNYRRHGTYWGEQLVIDLIIPVSWFERTDLAITSLLAIGRSHRSRNAHVISVKAYWPNYKLKLWHRSDYPDDENIALPWALSEILTRLADHWFGEPRCVTPTELRSFFCELLNLSRLFVYCWTEDVYLCTAELKSFICALLDFGWIDAALMWQFWCGAFTILNCAYHCNCRTICTFDSNTTTPVHSFW